MDSAIRISAPELTSDKEFVELHARTEIAGTAARFPSRLWFKVPRRFEAMLSRDVDAFVVALSSLASSLDRPIEVEAPVCERLCVGLEEYWAIVSGWAPRRYHPIRLASRGTTSGGIPAGAAAAAFSGGVDSFFTLHRGLRSQAQRPPTHRIRHALLIHGFDIPLAERRTYDTAAAAYEEELAKLGVELVRVETNVREFVPSANWEMGHGSALCGTALTIANGARRFFVPSSKSYSTLEPWGSDPLIDGLLSTDRFQIIHDGARYTRFQKLAAMRDWECIRRLLRTCYEHRDGLRNCGRCQNCRRTMMVLAALGILDEFETFPAIASPRHFLTSHWETPHERLFGRQAIACAKDSGRDALLWAGRFAMVASRLRQVGTTIKVGSRPLRRRLSARAQAWTFRASPVSTPLAAAPEFLPGGKNNVTSGG